MSLPIPAPLTGSWVLLAPEMWMKMLRRIQLCGPPYSGKTTGAMTLPPPRAYLVVPGEFGATSLPADDPETKVYTWPQYSPDNNPQEGLRLFNQTAEEVRIGKHGQFRSVIVDGGHVYAELTMKALGWTAYTLDDDMGSRQYPKYYDAIMKFFKRMAAPDNGIEFFCMTCYDGREAAEDAQGARIKKQTMIWPEMPGKLAKLIMGAFPCTYHTERIPGNPVDLFYWRLRPQGMMQAAGMHIPPRILAKLPASIEVKVDLATGVVGGGWQTLERLIAEASK